TLAVSRQGRPSFTLPLAQADGAISGEPLVEAGASAVVSFHDPAHRQPRTAVGLDRDEKRLFLVVVDGRQPNFSEGVSLQDLASISNAAGAYAGLNRSGGASSALVIEGSDGEPEDLGSPIHTRIPGRERPVGNHLGIRAERE